MARIDGIWDPYIPRIVIILLIILRNFTIDYPQYRSHFIDIMFYFNESV